jgi:hypothetical protein
MFCHTQSHANNSTDKSNKHPRGGIDEWCVSQPSRERASFAVRPGQTRFFFCEREIRIPKPAGAHDQLRGIKTANLNTVVIKLGALRFRGNYYAAEELSGANFRNRHLVHFLKTEEEELLGISSAKGWGKRLSCGSVT